MPLAPGQKLSHYRLVEALVAELTKRSAEHASETPSRSDP